MKKFIFTAITLLITLFTVLALASCDSGSSEAVTTSENVNAATTAKEIATEPATEAATTEAEVTTTIEEIETTVEEVETTVSEEPTTAAEEVTLATKDGDIIINTADDFINLNKAVLGYMEDASDDYFEGITVYFTSDIDMSGYEWVPMDGSFFDDVTFDGMGHKITNLTIVDQEDNTIGDVNGNMHGFGIIQNAYYDLTFKDLIFENAKVTAYKQHVAILVGTVFNGATITCKNVQMYDVRIEGSLAEDKDAGRSFSIRTACFVGAIMGSGFVDFSDCKVDGAYISGFHNLAAFLGYDGSTTIDATCFTNCSAFNIEMEFSYCQSESYTNKKPFAFVSVFFNATQWLDNVDECKDEGNFYSNITYKDWTTDETFDADNFRSWTEDSEYIIAYTGGTTFKNIPETR